MKPSYVPEMQLSLGIDLASQNKNTAACFIEWRADCAFVRCPVSGPAGEDVDWLVELAKQARWVGIDAPFGWPEAAVNALVSWAGGGRWPDASKDEMRYRVTDRYVRETTGIPPLSVSSDRIAVAAWRCARLLDALRTDRPPVDRMGGDGIFEVYPGAALTCWGFNRVGYKRGGNAASKQRQRQARVELTTTLTDRAPWLDLTAATRACWESDDAFDALVASLVARAAGLGLTVKPPPGEEPRISREGWIHLPESTALERLL
jgi:predicted nuclease with RNAse H fold